ncbi:MAG: MogA/MoaB family molybdenum cofactor biosynthesis protein [Rhodothermales bacterium]|jgi:molybdenum cofactor biosynthesis protein B
MGYTEHKALSKDQPITCAVVTVSDTRTEDDDKSGALMVQRLKDNGHPVNGYRIVPDDLLQIQEAVSTFAETVDVILLNGGTGITRRDGTFEALSALIEKPMPGFGELFRMLSFEEIGGAAMLSRASAGVYRNTIVFSTPGSTAAVRLAMDRLIVPELRHLVWELVRQ